MVRCWIYSAGRDQCQCYNVDDENLADLAAQMQFFGGLPHPTRSKPGFIPAAA